MSVLENEEVKRFIFGYPNENTRVNIAHTIYTLIKAVREIEPDFNIRNLLDMDAVQARERITKSTVLSPLHKKYNSNSGKVVFKIWLVVRTPTIVTSN